MSRFPHPPPPPPPQFEEIRAVVETHKYIAMDTEFPGVVARPVSEVFKDDYHYQSLKCNVDLLKIIQLGLAFADEKGEFKEVRRERAVTREL